MNWYHGETDIQAKFNESQARAGRSNELRELATLEAQRRAGQRIADIGRWHFWRRMVVGWFSHRPATDVEVSGSTPPRMTRAFRQK